MILFQAMGNQWRKIFVRPPVEGMNPQRLDESLMGMLPAAVTQYGDNYTYKPDSNGLYEVRILLDNEMTASMARGVIGHEGYTLVREEEYDGGTIISTIEHEPINPSDFPGRRK
jgi:hypothetical protein